MQLITGYNWKYYIQLKPVNWIITGLSFCPIIFFTGLTGKIK
jgi:hypothetical protein